MAKKIEHFGYAQAGVDTATAESALQGLLKWIEKTYPLRKKVGRAKLPSGYFANVVDIGKDMGVAISTDGVGTKILLAQMMDKYDTIGIDLIAMNVNDVLCVGAEPISLVDYIAVQAPAPSLLEEIGKGLYEGARMAEITIPGGEVAQVKEMVQGVKKNYGFDLVGTCIGLVPMDKIIIGQEIEEGDTVMALMSSGIHSNGLTLARKVFFDKKGLKVDKYLDELGKTIGEELLKPTRIYVREVKEILKSNLAIKALIHITGDGLLNLTRVKADVGYILDNLPEPQPIFSLTQKYGNLSDEEMYRVYNMGVGFCLIISPKDVEAATNILKKQGTDCLKMGYAVLDKQRKVRVEPKKLVLSAT